MFSDSFFDALGSWQRGWREDQAERLNRASHLLREASGLPHHFRKIDAPCFRKRFLYIGDFAPLLAPDGVVADGMASWTLDQSFADTFKGIERQGAVTAAIFRCEPESSEVVVSIPALWASDDFRRAAEDYRLRNGAEAEAIWKVADRQQEVVLNRNARCLEIVAFSGKSSPFEELCEAAGVAPEDYDAAWRLLIDLGKQPETPRYVRAEQVRRILERVNVKIQRLRGIG
jgi:hypothetical protein